MPIVKLSCEYCKKNHTCKATLVEPELKQVYIYKKTKEQMRREKIEQMKPIVKMKKMEFNLMN